MPPLKKTVSIFVRIGISVILLVVLLRFNKIDLHELIQDIRGADKPLLVLAFFIFFSSYVLCLFRWAMLLGALKIHLPFKRVIISFGGGIFFNLFLPSTIGGDLMRSIDLAAHTQRPKQVIATVFLDRLSGYTGLVIMALSALVLGWGSIRDKSVVFSILAIAGILVFILFVLFNRFLYSKISWLLERPDAGRLRESLKDLHQEIHYFRDHKKVILQNVLLSILIQAGGPLTFFVIALSLGLKIELIYFFIFLPIIGAITLLPISIGGLGLREATTTIFFAKVGVDSHAAIAMSLVNSSFLFVCGALGGLIYVLTVHHRRLQHHQPSSVRAPQ